MGEKRRRFDPEFRAGAVRIVAETGKPVAQVARDLGISAHTLHNWCHRRRETGLSRSVRPCRTVSDLQAAAVKREAISSVRRMIIVVETIKFGRTVLAVG